jgi:hypothetical protein
MQKIERKKQGNYQPRWTQFITRTKDTDLFFRVLGEGGLLNSIEVLGTRSAGVTNFLQQLYKIHKSKTSLKESQNLVMVFVDVEHVTTQADFYAKIITASRNEINGLLEGRLTRSLKKGLKWVGEEEISRTLVPSLMDSLLEMPEDNRAVSLEEFRTWVEILLRRFRNAYFAFLIDGFDQIANHKDQFTNDFLNFLRALCRDGHLCWVVGTHRSVVDLCRDICGDHRISPFSNIFGPAFFWAQSTALKLRISSMPGHLNGK